MQTFIESLGANAILFGVYLGYQVINRCLHSTLQVSVQQKQWAGFRSRPDG